VKRALKRYGSSEAVTTDGLRSYKAAMKDLGNTQKQEIGRGANNRVENSLMPFRRREVAMLRLRQMDLSGAHGPHDIDVLDRIVEMSPSLRRKGGN
jgi:transposase-like protein